MITAGTHIIPARRLLDIEHIAADPTVTVCGLPLDIDELWIEWGKGGVTTCATCTNQAVEPALDLFGETT